MRTDRLIKLANFLQDLPNDKFHFGVWTGNCGTVACGLGWCATVFEKEGFTIANSDIPSVLDVIGYEAGERFFGLTEKETHYLFAPNNLNVFSEVLDGKRPWLINILQPINVSPRQVSRRIMMLAKHKIRREHKWKQYEYSVHGKAVTDKRGVYV